MTPTYGTTKPSKRTSSQFTKTQPSELSGILELSVKSSIKNKTTKNNNFIMISLSKNSNTKMIQINALILKISLQIRVSFILF